MKRISFSLFLIAISFFSLMQQASAQWLGTNPVTTMSKVGIGTANPSQKLQIVGGNILLDNTDVPATTGNIFFGDITYPAFNEGMRLSYFKTSHNGYMDVRTTMPTEGIIFRVDQGTTPGTERMRICANGNVGIGVIPGAYRLNVNGNAYISGTLTVASDRRFKKDIATLNDAMATINRLRGVQYEYNQDAFADRNFPTGKTTGFIAQEVREVLPELVTEGSDGYLGVNYQGIIPVLTEALKELRTEKDQQIASLESRLAKLEAMVAQTANAAPVASTSK
ncbi:MAG: tail fiber domain-containing protein [Bacteroidota bacterium]